MAGMMNEMMEKLRLSKKKKSEGVPAQEPGRQELEELRKKYEEAEQDQVFHYYDELDVAGKASLFEQLSEIGPHHINQILEKALGPAKSKKDAEGQKDETSKGGGEDEEEGKGKQSQPDLQPLPDSASASLLDARQEDVDEWSDHGLRLVADNQVAVVLMAGGQGTRLGSSEPKGCYNVGLPSGKSLFQLQAERIWKVQQLAALKHGKDKVVVPWYIMTSGPTRRATQDFFEKHAHFGLEPENVVFFEQGVLPCVSDERKILLEDKSKVSVAPDGNGGLYTALYLGAVLSDMGKRGVQHVHAYCVDNCLVRVADPTFIGFAASKGVDIATKVVRKRSAKESVGLIVQKDGKPDVVEYSEMDAGAAEETDPKDSQLLRFRAANIVNHYYSYAFLEGVPQWAHRLPHHVARKKIPHLDLDTGKAVKPEKPNGIKLEQFVFDCFNLVPMDRFACLEVRREEEFSPLKNAPGAGEDDPDTSRRHVLEQGRRWAEAGGAVVTGDGEGVEVSPRISYAGEGLEFLSKQTIKQPAVIEREPSSEAK